MAIQLGVNCGFVTVAPTADPSGAAAAAMDQHALVQKDTSPATAAEITEVGWWCDNATEEANFEVALCSADGAVVPGEAGTRLYVDDTNAKGTDAGWKRVTVDWAITELTDYWGGVQLDDTATATLCNYTSSGGPGFDDRTGQTTFPNPFGGGAIVQATGMIAFYMLWEPAEATTYTVTYDDNDSTGGTVPTDGNSPYDENDEVTVLGNIGSLVKTGSTFAGWNTAADGSGIHYPIGGRFNISANIVLYAIWLVSTKVVVAGGQGTMEDASDDNGGAYSPASSYTEFQGENGGPLYTVPGCFYSSGTGMIQNYNGGFAEGLEGIWVHSKEGAAGAWVEARHQILYSYSSGIMIEAGLGSNVDIDVWVGGALKYIETLFDVKEDGDTIRNNYINGLYTCRDANEVTLQNPSGGGTADIFNNGVIR